ncbi:hypothetical protein OsI_37030 [Oryza sativa Indica Group]|uniref:Uncharacterized protein n=1 Tax=Oryza sativa subsp. indica TaxID=39946 RepID=A2ZGY0_ORYSI|nr:hypothetical protein OsI_37030 [Oryza sativa Indica Group]
MCEKGAKGCEQGYIGQGGATMSRENEDAFMDMLLLDPIENRYKNEEVRAQATRDLSKCIVDHRMAAKSLPTPEQYAQKANTKKSEDMQYKRRIILNFPTLRLTDSQKKAYALIEIEKLMRQAGKSLRDYPDIELPNAAEIEELGNRLINEELNYDKDQLKDEHLAILNSLNTDQKKAFDAIMESINGGQGKQIFILRSCGLFEAASSRSSFWEKLQLGEAPPNRAVAFSRVTNRNGLKVLIDDSDCPEENVARNIVYKEIF